MGIGARRESRRDAILAAASDLLREQGSAEAVTVEQIAGRAGVAKATLYRHFRSKAGIARALAEKGVDVAAFRVEERRVRILEGALRAFARWGFRGATMERIGQEAGISAGAIYWYFPSKDDLIRALFETQSALPQLRQLAALPAGDEEAQLTAVAESLLRTFEERIDVIKTVMSEGLAHPEIARKFYRELVAKVWAEFARYLDVRVAAGVFRPGDSLARTQAFISMLMLYALARRNFGEQFSVPREVAVREFVGVFLRGVSGPADRQLASKSGGDGNGRDSRKGGA